MLFRAKGRKGCTGATVGMGQVPTASRATRRGTLLVYPRRKFLRQAAMQHMFQNVLEAFVHPNPSGFAPLGLTSVYARPSTTRPRGGSNEQQLS